MEGQLIRSLPSTDAIKLANALYQVYRRECSPLLHIRKSLICQLYGWTGDEWCDVQVASLFNELNEPSLVENFIYKGELIEWKVVAFCQLISAINSDYEYIDIEINELFLAVLQSEKSETLIAFSEIPK